MLGKGRAVELMDSIGTEVRRLIEPGAGVPDALRLERIADAIVSIEYYMETLQNGRADPWYMLDNAEICLKALAADVETRVPNVELPASDAAKTVKLDPESTLALEESKRAQAATDPLIALAAAPPFAAPPRPRPQRKWIRSSWNYSSRRRRKRSPRSTRPSRSGTRIRWIWKPWHRFGAVFIL